MKINFKEIAGAFVVLFAILDIIGAIPIIINLQRKTGKVPALKVSTISWALLVIIYFLGDGVLALFGVDVESFAVAGSIVVLAVGFEMIFDITIFRHDSGPKSASSIVPLVFPLIVGPGSFTTLLSLKAEYTTTSIMIALFLNVIVIYVVLSSIDRIEKTLGPTFVYVLRKFFGIILLAISVKLFMSNIGHIY